MRSMPASAAWRRRGRPSARRAAAPAANASASVALVDHVAQVDAEVHDGLRDLRPDAADDAVGAHQPRRRDRLEQVLGDQRVDGGHAGDVDDRRCARRCRRCCWSRFSITTCVRALSSVPISGSAEDAVPQLHDRRRQLEHLLLLRGDELLARLLVDLGRVEAERVEQSGGRPDLVGQRARVPDASGAAARTAAASARTRTSRSPTA